MPIAADSLIISTTILLALAFFSAHKVMKEIALFVLVALALQAAHLDGWLFCDFRGSDPLAPRILMLGDHASGSRRWFYYIPATGEPTKIVHSIERYKLDALPGKR